MYHESLYEEYWEDLACKLSDLRHTQAEPHYFFLSDTGDLSELSKALRNVLLPPMLVMDEPTLRTDGSGAGQKVTLMGAFTVLEKVEAGSATDLRRVRKSTMAISRKLLNRMKRDSRAAFGEESSLLLANAIQLGEIAQYPAPLFENIYTGWTVEFTWLLPDDIAFGIDDFEA